jgi:hypothetical protein
MTTINAVASFVVVQNGALWVNRRVGDNVFNLLKLFDCFNNYVKKIND